MVPVSLFDSIEVRKKKTTKGIDLSATGLIVPENESNLAARAAQAFFSRIGSEDGLSIKINKHIPVSAGLGGGSSDAAATLLLLNEIYSNPLSEDDLRALALRLGADVPFFLLCKPCLASGIGEILEPLEKWPELYYVIVSPQVPISTAWVYRNYRMKLTKGEYASIKDWLKRDLLPISQILENDLESVTSAKFPIIRTVKELLMENGAKGALMSGSGSSVFGVFGSPEEAELAKKQLTSLNLGDVFVTANYARKK
jgi:4-diphosphocytidyl-2-C-methyl-D-erythritol kinase